MGSTPSSENQDQFVSHSSNRLRHFDGNHRKQSLQASKNRKKQSDIPQANTQQKGQTLSTKKEIKSKENPEITTPIPNQNGLDQDIKQTKNQLHEDNYQEIARKNIPKKSLRDVQLEEEVYQNQQNLRQSPINMEKHERYHYPLKKRTQIDHQNHKRQQQQQIPVTYERPKGRHYVKDINLRQHKNQQSDYINNSNIIKKSHRKSEEIDYHQFDSAHIRHKAMQEVRQQDHPIHPIKAKQPVYEHEKLYPKIMKNFHQQPHLVKSGNHRTDSNNRHYQHQRNVEEEYYQQPHKLNLYKRHAPNHKLQQNQEEEPEPKSHPNFKKNQQHRNNPNLEQNQSLNELKKSLNVKKKVNNHEDNPKKRKNSISQQEEIIDQAPKNPNFRKRKASIPPQQIDKNQLEKAKNKLIEFQQKSIADFKKQNEQNLTEYDSEPPELIACREGCGRKFIADRIDKHQAICRKVFQQKRKQFNTQDQRIISKQQKKLLKRIPAKNNQQHKKQRISKWKAQSIALRAHIKMGMDQNYAPNQQQLEMLSQQHHIDIVNCAYCGRNFNKNAAKTHIPFCKSKYQKQIERQRFQKHPRTSRK